jgi:hypothetical protein
MKILYASEEEKVNIDDNGQLTITGGGVAVGHEEDMLNEENKDNDEDESLV